MTPHKLAGLFPEMPDEEFEALVADVRRYGVREPIVVYEGCILDGRHRWRAAQAAGVPCPTRTFEGNHDAALSLVVSTNLHRRHLTTSQRAMVAASLANMVVGGKEANSANLHNCSIEQAAAKLSVSPRSVKTARKLQKDAPALAAKVAAGAMNLNAASEQARPAVVVPVALPSRTPVPQPAQGTNDLSPVGDAIHNTWGLFGNWLAGMLDYEDHNTDLKLHAWCLRNGIDMTLEEMQAFMWFAGLDDGVRNLAVRAVPRDKGMADFRRAVDAIMGATT